MQPTRENHAKITNRGLHDVIIESTEKELREITGDQFEELAAMGQAAVFQALEECIDPSNSRDDNMHRGLSALLRMLRFRDQLSIEELAHKARVDPIELQQIELEPSYEAHPRTIYQLEQFFKLKKQSLAVLSGVVRVSDEESKEIGDVAVHFAANSDNIPKLTREQKKRLHEFVKFLSQHTD